MHTGLYGLKFHSEPSLVTASRLENGQSGAAHSYLWQLNRSETHVHHPASNHFNDPRALLCSTMDEPAVLLVQRARRASDIPTLAEEGWSKQIGAAKAGLGCRWRGQLRQVSSGIWWLSASCRSLRASLAAHVALMGLCHAPGMLLLWPQDCRS